MPRKSRSIIEEKIKGVDTTPNIASVTQRSAAQRSVTQRNATQRNATQSNATQSNAT